MEKAPEQQPAPPAIRASDADRDRYAEILREAMAEGRIDAEEHGERIDAVYSAKTVGELEPLVKDLPVAGRPAATPAPSSEPASLPAPSTVSPTIFAVFGGVNRKGRWRVPPQTQVVSAFGGVELDFTEAVFEHREVVIDARVIFGGLNVRVPENVTLRGSGSGLFGGFDVKEHEADDPNAPVVTVRGFALFGGVTAKRRKGKKLADWNRKKPKQLGD
jgi:hypothetical protein